MANKKLKKEVDDIFKMEVILNQLKNLNTEDPDVKEYLKEELTNILENL